MMTESGGDTFFKIEDRTHTVDEVAKIFMVTPLTVRLWITHGNKAGVRLAAMKVGKRWHISRDAMMEWANAQMSA